MKYDVLWIEDESEKNPNFVALCEIKGINITIKENSEAGLRELKRRDVNYDAVILDAKVKMNMDSSPNLEGLRAARDYLLGLKGREFIPHFIYTGQTDYQESSLFEESYGKYYVKTEHDELLVNDILKAVEDRPNAMIKSRYPEVFELFKNGFIDIEYEKHLLKILRSISDDGTKLDDELFFNQLRQMLEVAMRRANDAGILHDECMSKKGEVILQLSSLFLSGFEIDALGIKCKQTHFPKIISNHVREIIDITNVGSHADKDGKDQSEANLKEYRKKLNTPYLLYSLTFKLMDVLLWFSEYIKENNNIELNKSYWVDLSESDVSSKGKWIIGTVTKVADNGFGTLILDGGSESLSIIPKMVSELQIQENDRLRVTTKPSPDGSQTHINEIEKI